MSDFATISFVSGARQNSVSVTDRGLAYGDGLFETLRLEAGRLPFWTLHRERLLEGCARLGIDLSPVELDRQVSNVLNTASDEAIARAVLKILVTRGLGARGYQPDPSLQPTVILLLNPLPAHLLGLCESGIGAFICQHRLPDNPALAGIKHLNRLDHVLASLEWRDGAWQEGILLDPRGGVVEACSRNIFAVSGNKLMTPLLFNSGVAGILRRRIMESYADRAGLAVEECQMGLDDLLRANEVFVGNSVTGVWPLRSVSDHSGPLASFEAGDASRHIQKLFEHDLTSKPV